MNRRSFLTRTLLGTALAASPAASLLLKAEQVTGASRKGIVVSTDKLNPPARGKILVAIAISENTTLIDFAGPMDVFGSVMIPERGPGIEDQVPFRMFLVSEKIEPITIEFGAKITPDYTFASVPPCKVAIIPWQQGSDAMQGWLKKTALAADVTMSVCVGVKHLAKAGLLAGKSATTHHNNYARFAQEYPEVDLRRGVRFVENEKISTSGGETCGIDLSLRIVERYFGRGVAEKTALFIEHQGDGWKV